MSRKLSGIKAPVSELFISDGKRTPTRGAGVRLLVLSCIAGAVTFALLNPATGDDSKATSAIPASVLSGIPVDARGDLVVIGSDGVTHKTVRSSGGDLKTPAVTAGQYQDENGVEIAAPQWLPPSATRGFARGSAAMAIFEDKQTGPFHGVYSQPGYSFEEAEVYLPSDHARPPGLYLHRPGSTDTAYVYLGGQSRTGGAVDAGFQHSPSRDNWALFITCEGFPFHVSRFQRFASGQTVDIRFFVPADNYVAVSASGLDITGRHVTRTVVLDVDKYPSTAPPAPGTLAGQSTRFTWTASGDGNILKRMTSIAQHRQSWSTRSFMRGIRWRNVRIGKGADRLHEWTFDDEAETVNWPDKRHIVVDARTPADETVNILLNR